MTDITSAGYIVTGYDFIHGVGATPEEAWNDAKRELAMAHIGVVDEATYDANGDRTENETLRSDYTISPATRALIDLVERSGGDQAWRTVGGVCCTLWEESLA